RASILTGQYPHDTGIFRNTGADGGFRAFYARGKERSTYATTLAAAGYRTALGGAYVPPGWSDWVVAGNGYPGFGYKLTRNVRIVRHGYRASDYLTNV